ncbi:MAG TPA: amidohydrolase [Thermomicrobiaceae bacterium]|nr:amidohydrolase [Thermomicrobiaceae bacterium]
MTTRYGADRLLLNGRIRTFDPAAPTVQAVAIRDGRILASGSDAELAELRAGHTEAEDLQGASVVPGLIDAHNHFLNTSLVLRQVQLYAARSLDDILRLVAARAAEAAAGEWIVGRGWDETLLTEGRPPTRWELDRVAPHNPVVLHRVWNKLVANSAALAAAGITRDTPQPGGERYAGSFDVDPESGEPTGLFRDRAKDLILRAVPPPAPAELVEALRAGSRAYNAVGITSVAEPGLDPTGLRAFQQAREQGALSVRTDMLLGAWGYVPASREPELKRWIAEMGVAGGFGDDWLRLAGVKFMLDGGAGDRTARLNRPYDAEPESVGQWVVDPEEYPQLVEWVHRQGWPMDTHTCGDAAQDLAVRAYAAAQRAAPNPRLRHRIHHAYLPTPETLALMARHQTPALVSNPFIVHLGESFVLSLGQERAGRIMPMASYLRAGVPLVGSSDSPIADFNPWVGMYAAVARRTIAGRELAAEERIAPEAALRSYTATAAWALGLEGRRGALVPGALADLVQLDRDPLSVSPEELRDTVVQRTMVDGQWVYERGAGA